MCAATVLHELMSTVPVVTAHPAEDIYAYNDKMHATTNACYDEDDPQAGTPSM
jgi:hypothetical protein